MSKEKTMKDLEVTIDGVDGIDYESANVVTDIITVPQEIYEQYFLPFIEGNEEKSNEIIDYFCEGNTEFFHYVDDPDWEWTVTEVKEVSDGFGVTQ
jgi:hypothetical protein